VLAALATQRGAAQLFVTVILLLIVMMVGITSTIIASTQFKLAGNLQFENNAFNQAESAAAVAQSWLRSTTPKAIADNAAFQASNGSCTGHLCAKTTTDPIGAANRAYTIDWTDANSLAVGGDETKRYFIQQVAKAVRRNGPGAMRNEGDAPVKCEPLGDLYRVSARGMSAKGTTKIVQSNVLLAYCG
jgi:Tfp pilus assembly protein PilX